MARHRIKSRSAKGTIGVVDDGQSAVPIKASLGNGKFGMTEAGQDAEASDYPAGPSRGGKGRSKNKKSPGITTHGKGA